MQNFLTSSVRFLYFDKHNRYSFQAFLSNSMILSESWRWFGPNDPISLQAIRKTGATHIVTALHHRKAGEVWPIEEILEIKNQIQTAGLEWSVVESIPVHESIKLGLPEAKIYVENYKQSILNLAECGIFVVCYNFMPVLDWTRTELEFEFEDKTKALYFNKLDYVAFCENVVGIELSNESAEVKQQAKERFQQWDEIKIEQLTRTVLAGLPGSFTGYSIHEFRDLIRLYESMDETQLAFNLITFLKAIIPVAESVGVFLTLHPDDPPFSLFGIPRIASRMEHFEKIASEVNSYHNGFCLCTGSLGVNPSFDFSTFISQFGSRIHFVHLRNVHTFEDGSFVEANHLSGNTDMISVIQELVKESKRRISKSENLPKITFRPDHGHRYPEDEGLQTPPGYPYIGRLRGLSELRGVITAIERIN